MEHITLNIDHLGMGTVSSDWYLAERTRMQRLYYIRSGNDFYKTSTGKYAQMEPHKLYIFPYNFYAEFHSVPNIPIDHIYFDFLSAPPIVAENPLIYDITENSALYVLIKYIEKLLVRFDLRGMTQHKIQSIVSAKEGSFDEERQIMYHRLHLLLLNLSYKHSIPFLKDDMINRSLLYIRENYANDLCLDKLAYEANFEKHYYIRRFKEVMGETPHMYIKKFRLVRARELLTAGLTYNEVAQQVGYKNGKTLWNAINKQK